MNELQVAAEAAQAAGSLLLLHWRRGVQAEEKSKGDLVSVADRESQALLRDRISAAFPDDLFVGEEGEPVDEEAVRGRRRWYVDPLDGTNNFVKGRRWWGVSIGFCDADDRVTAGVIRMPCWEETFAAALGGGATRNGAPVRCSPVTNLREAWVTTGFPGATGRDNLPPVERVLTHALDVRVMGALAPDLCAVACGRSDGAWSLRPEPWDIAAGMLIAAEAGAAVTDLDGAEASVTGNGLLAAAPGIQPKLRRLITGE
jgi:myo-inositol-1(or 4)-monophosphatase